MPGCPEPRPPFVAQNQPPVWFPPGPPGHPAQRQRPSRPPRADGLRIPWGEPSRPRRPRCMVWPAEEQ
eukprot:12655668-Alexandrium_andersonii.AAC.1